MVIVPLYDELLGRCGGTDIIQTGIWLLCIWILKWSIKCEVIVRVFAICIVMCYLTVIAAQRRNTWQYVNKVTYQRTAITCCFISSWLNRCNWNIQKCPEVILPTAVILWPCFVCSLFHFCWTKFCCVFIRLQSSAVKQLGFICNGLQVPVQQQMVQGPMQSPLQQQQPPSEATDEVAHQEHFQDLKVTPSQHIYVHCLT